MKGIRPGLLPIWLILVLWGLPRPTVAFVRLPGKVLAQQYGRYGRLDNFMLIVDCAPPTPINILTMTKSPSSSLSSSTAKIAATATTSSSNVKKRAIYLSHERDFFRQEARLNSMDSYVLVSTLTSSMSFGCLCGFAPTKVAAEIAIAWQRLGYQALCQAITIVSGLVTVYGLYSTIIFSLTLLYSKSALGAERDRAYNIFLRRSIRCGVRAARCFSWSMALFVAEAVLVLMERLCFQPKALSWTILPVAVSCLFTLYRLTSDWWLLHDSTEVIYKD